MTRERGSKVQRASAMVVNSPKSKLSTLSNDEDEVSVLKMDRYGEDPDMMRTLKLRGQQRDKEEAIPRHTERSQLSGLFRHSFHTRLQSSKLQPPSKRIPNVIFVEKPPQASSAAVERSKSTHSFDSSASSKHTHTMSTSGSSSTRSHRSTDSSSSSRKSRSSVTTSKQGGSERSERSRSTIVSASLSPVPTRQRASLISGPGDKNRHSLSPQLSHQTSESVPSLSPTRRVSPNTPRKSTRGADLSSKKQKEGEYLDRLFATKYQTHQIPKKKKGTYIDRLFENDPFTLSVQRRIDSVPDSTNRRMRRRASHT
jgi:hypothetical protein